MAPDTNITTLTGGCRRFQVEGAFKGGSSIHTDEAMYLQAHNNEFYYAKVQQVIYCKRLPNETFGTPISESRAVIPVDIGGPSTTMNEAQGFTLQHGWPLYDPPYQVRRGFCPGTEVTVTTQCPRKGNGMKSRDSKGTIIPKWCCRNCSLAGIHMIDSLGECWMPGEARPEVVEVQEATNEKETPMTLQHEEIVLTDEQVFRMSPP